MTLASSAFADQAAIPRRFTCDGADTSPPLRWSGVPAAARELTLVVEDVDAHFTHWTVLEIPPAVRAMRAGQAPAGAVETENSFGHRGYGGPCPPKGDRPHRYVFTLYATRAPLGLGASASPDDVTEALTRLALARGLLTGRYARAG
jgi:Raf kinase inhibitor-like YbhB/YbcL family protein